MALHSSTCCFVYTLPSRCLVVLFIQCHIYMEDVLKTYKWKCVHLTYFSSGAKKGFAKKQREFNCCVYSVSSSIKSEVVCVFLYACSSCSCSSVIRKFDVAHVSCADGTQLHDICTVTEANTMIKKT